MVPHNTILLSKLEKYGFDGWTVHGQRTGSRTEHRVVVNDSMSGQRSPTSGVPCRSVLGLILFNIFINDTDSEIKCIPINFVDDTKLCDVVHTPEG